jgi:hypothetical protein
MAESTNPSLRRRLREPITEIFAAAEALKLAVAAHFAGDVAACEALVRSADDPAVREWARPFLGAGSKNPFLHVREVAGAPPLIPRAERLPPRMPPNAMKTALRERDGYNCLFCGIPLIRGEVRKAFGAAYPRVATWGPKNEACHAGFQCMSLQYDHVLPYSRGGENSLENLIVTCAPCNYGRMEYTLEEVGLIDPRTQQVQRTEWDGLESFLCAPHRAAQLASIESSAGGAASAAFDPPTLKH